MLVSLEKTRRHSTGRLLSHGALLTFFLVGSASADDTPNEGNRALIYTHNDAEARLLVIDPENESAVADIWLRDAFPEWCMYGDLTQACFLLGGHHLVVDGHDYAAVAAARRENLFTAIVQISFKDEAPVWFIDQVDFTGVESNRECTKPCGAPGAVPAACRLGEVHGLNVVAQDLDAKWAEVITTDPGNSRVERVHLDYSDGNTCAQAQWVLDDSNPGWPPLSWPNAVQYLEEPEGEFVLVSYYNEGTTTPAGGRVRLFQIQGDELTLVWAFPDDASSPAPYLMEPHGARINTDPATGQRFLTYAHSAGLAKRGGDNNSGGTLGIARIDSIWDPPTYLGEWILPDAFDPLDFPREFEILSDGRMLASDAGCFWIAHPALSCPSEIYLLDPETLPSSNLGGTWTKRHNDQNIVELSQSEVIQEVSCGLQLIFEADYIPADALGSDLRHALDAGGVSCADL